MKVRHIVLQEYKRCIVSIAYGTRPAQDTLTCFVAFADYI